MQLNALRIEEWRKIQDLMTRLREVRSQINRDTDSSDYVDSFRSVQDTSFNLFGTFYDLQISAPYANFISSLGDVQEAIYDRLKVAGSTQLMKNQAMKEFIEDLMKDTPWEEIPQDLRDQYEEIRNSLDEHLDGPLAEPPVAYSAQAATDRLLTTLDQSIDILNDLHKDYREIIGANGRITKAKERKFWETARVVMARDEAKDRQ